MADGGPIDFSALRPLPDIAGGYANAFRVGQDLGRGMAPQNAGELHAGNPQTGTQSPMAGDVGSTFGSLADLEAQLGAVPPPQHAAAVTAAQAHNELLAHVLLGLKGYPPGARLGIAQHMAQATGLLNPNAITDGDVSDQGIDMHLAQAMSVEQFLKTQEAGRTGPPGDSPAEFQAAPGLDPMLRFNPQTGQVE